MIALVLFVVLIALIMIGVPVGFALGGATIIIMQFFTKLDLSMVASYSVTGVDSLTMMAIPFFILSGVVMSVGGLARRLVDVAASLVGWMMGGLGAVVSLASMFFGAISGSSLATVSCIGGIMVPEMQKKGLRSRLQRSFHRLCRYDRRSDPAQYPAGRLRRVHQHVDR